jgi:hypothetical protein
LPALSTQPIPHIRLNFFIQPSILNSICNHQPIF